MFNVKKLNKYFIDHDPIWFSIVYVFTMIAFVIALIFEPALTRTASLLVRLIAWFFLVGPVGLTVLHLINYKKTVSSMPRLISLYMQIVIMFGCLHFYNSASFISSQLTTRSSEPGSTAVQVKEDFSRIDYKESIKGIDGNWIIMLLKGEAPKKEIVKSAMMCFYNSMHFSLMTSTTVGYGDMYPMTFSAKLMVDIQVLVSFFIIAFGVGSFFAHKEHAKREKIRSL